jgi:ketosteroid isomerase-like protein
LKIINTAISISLFFSGLAWADEHFPREAREAVRSEIQQALDNYSNAMLTHNYDAMAAFWSTSDDFVMAGDGRILGGSDAWVKLMDQYYEDFDKYYVWDYQDVHILPLSERSAVATVEMRFRWHTTKDEIMNSRGSWTYVFRKEDGVWKVVHSNGTHVPL